MKLYILWTQDRGGSLTTLDDNGNAVNTGKLTEVTLYDSRDDHVVGSAHVSRRLDRATIKPISMYAPKGGKIPTHRTKKDEYLRKEHIFIVETARKCTLWCDLAYLDMENSHTFNKPYESAILCTISLDGIAEPFTSLCWTDEGVTILARGEYSDAVDALKFLQAPSEEKFDAAIQAVKDSFRRWKNIADAAAKYSIEDYLAGKSFKY